MKNFTTYRNQIIGIEQTFKSPDGEKRLIYADWTASGRLYRPIEEYLINRLGPFVANPHTETTMSGIRMTEAYHQAQQIIKKHVHANDDDAIFFAGFGMTAVINKLQRLLGLRVPENLCPRPNCQKKSKPLVIVTHMEHHSNQTSWNECCCDVKIIRRTDNGLPDLEHLEEILTANTNRELLIGSFSACSNVTGIHTPYGAMAAAMHRHGGYCFVDFAASAPYVKIDMHPDDPQQRLDAIFFSPHKFLGGPGSSGVMILNKELYHNRIPDHPGGGTVLWTNPWGEQHYYEDIEIREDGGTPGYLQAIRAALAVLLKEHMGIENILAREEELKCILLEKLCQHPQIMILEAGQLNRLGIISFYSLHRHHNLIVQLLNDRFGIQSRGGCSCAGTYGHILLRVEREQSRHITDLINQGDLSEKPGWVRISLHPTMNEAEVSAIAEAVHQVMDNYERWQQDYTFIPKTGEFRHRTWKKKMDDLRRDFKPV
ncbi:MAG: aminotransferase class V-fold PLP-dependent enzyme [Candidatus Aminicenantes bacterium]|nr:aminotransferase class V-fold PLP-dependent enzyme [Candidatus Aminicenantes bacterium]